jgi:type IV secretory pathway component VirB8
MHGDPLALPARDMTAMERSRMDFAARQLNLIACVFAVFSVIATVITFFRLF